MSRLFRAMNIFVEQLVATILEDDLNKYVVVFKEPNSRIFIPIGVE